MKYKLSSKGFNFIISFEKLELYAYLDPVGIATIGYGTTKLNGFPVALGMVINEPVAIALLYGSCQEVLKSIEKNVRNGFNQNQIDALCSFAYNVGIAAFTTSSLVTSINHKLEISESLFTRWNKGHIKGEVVELKGLTYRRMKEYELFMEKM